MKGSRFRTWLVACVSMASSALVVPGSGQEIRPPSEPMRFRRVLIPDGIPLPVAELHFPMKSGEFERLVADSQAGAARPPALVVSLSHDVRWVEPHGLRGESRFRIERNGQNGVLTLGPWNVAFGSIAWADISAEPLRWGHSADGRLAMWIDHSGDVLVTWTIAGTRLPSGDAQFLLELPTSPVARLVLETPPEFVAVLRAQPSTLELPKAQAAGEHEWQIVDERLELRLGPRREPGAEVSATLRENNVYELSTRGLSLTAEWTLDIVGSPVKEIEVDVEAPLHFVGAKYGDESLEWQDMLRGDTGTGRVRIALPAALVGSNRALTLAALTDELPNRERGVPRLRASGVFWQQGNSTLRVVAPLRLASAELTDGRVARQVPLTAPQSGTGWELQHFSPDWSVRFAVTSRAASWSYESGTSLVCAPDSHTAIYLLSADELPPWVTELQAAVADGWEIERVESRAGTVPIGWTQNIEHGHSKLVIDVSQRAAEGTWGLRIQASCTGPGLNGSDLELLTWNQGRAMTRLAAVHPADGFALEPSDGPSPRLLGASDFVDARSRLIVAGSNAWMLDLDAQADDLRLTARSITAASPRVASRTRVTAHRETWEYHYQLTLSGIAASQSSCDVQFAPPDESPVRWTTDDAAAVELIARRYSSDELTARSLLASAELWHIELPPGSMQQIVGTRTVPATAKREIALPIALNSEQEPGVVELTADAGVAIDWDAVGLEPLPIISHDASLQARLEFRPRPFRAGTPPPKVTVRRSQPSPSGGAIRELQITSHVGAGGAVRHRARLNILRGVRHELTLTVPFQTTLRGVLLDGQLTTWKADGSRAVLPLSSARECRLELLLQQEIEPSRWWLRLAPLDIQFDVPSLSRSQTIEAASVWTPVSRAAGDSAEFQKGTTVMLIHRDAAYCAAILGLAVLAVVGMRTGQPALSTALLLCLGAATLGHWPAALAWLPGWFAVMWSVVMCVRAASWFRVERLWARKPSGLATTAMVVILCATDRSASAQSSLTRLTAPESARNATYRVLIPADSDGRPHDYGWLVPEGLFSALHQRQSSARLAPHGLWLERAIYSGSLLWSREAGPVLELTARLRFHAFDADLELTLPWTAREVSADSVLIDGRVAETQIDPEGLRVVLARRGTFELETPLRLAAQIEAESSRYEVAIPATASCRVDLRVSPDLHVEAHGARGLTSREPHGTQFTAELGSIPRLSLRWSSDAPASEADVEADQYLLLELRPGAVLLRTKVSYRVVSGVQRDVRFSIDPRLRWLPLTQAGVAAASLAPSANDPSAVSVPLAQGVTGRWDFQATLLLTGHTGVGQLALPRLEPVGTVVRRRWLAIVVDPALEHRSVETAPSERIAAAEFGRFWGEPIPAHAAYLALPNRGPAPWFLQTWPQTERLRVAQHLRLVLDQRRCQWLYQARLQNTPGPVTTVRLQIPEAWHVARAEVRDESTPSAPARAVTLSEPDHGCIEMVVAGGASSTATLELTGTWNASLGPLEIPKIGISDSEVIEDRLELWRTPRVLVDGWRGESDEPTLPSNAAGDRRDLRYLGSLTRAEVPSNLQLVLNDPKVFVAQATVVDNTDTSVPQVDFVANVEVTGGVVDDLTWEVPRGWLGPEVVDPQGEIRSVTLDDGRRRITVRPVVPIHNAAAIALRGFRAGDASHDAIPHIAPLNVAGVEEFLVVRQRAGESPTDWELSGVQPSTLPPQLAEALPSDATSFRADGVDWQATRASQSPRRGAAWQTWRECDVLREPSGAWNAHWHAIVAPLGSDVIEYELPPGVRLVQAWIDERPALPLDDSPNRVRLRCTSREWPQAVDLLIAGSAPADRSANCELAAPRFVGKTTRTVLWRIDASRLPLQIVEGHSGERADAELIHLRRWQGILDAFAKTPLPRTLSDPTQRGLWFAPWKRRFDRARDAAPKDPDDWPIVLGHAEKTQREFLRLGLAKITVPPDDTPELSLLPPDRRVDLSRFAGDRIRFRISPLAVWLPRVERLARSACLIAGIALAWQLRPRRGTTRDALDTRP